jgi:hypothetical protein
MYVRKSYTINKLKNGIVLKEYPLYADTNSFIFDSSNILTIYSPSDKIIEMYTELVTEIYIEDSIVDEDDATAILNTLFDDDDNDEID